MPLRLSLSRDNRQLSLKSASRDGFHRAHLRIEEEGEFGGAAAIDL